MHFDDPPVKNAPAESALLSRRRNRKSQSVRPHAPGHTTTDPTSPEVMNSLITSLSTISVPLKTHFDNVPRIDTDSDPGLPEVPQTAPCFSNPHSDHGFGMSYGAYKTGEVGSFLHPDDAALSPVIRMARAPPSPKSPKSPRSPRFKSFKSAASSPARPASRESYSSVRAGPEDSIFGTITTEPGPRLSTAPSVASSGSFGRSKSLRSQFGLMKKASREFTSEKESQADRLRTASSHNDSLRHNTPRSRASMRSLRSMADVAEEERPSGVIEEPYEEVAELATSTPPTQEQSLQTTPDLGNNPGGIGSGRIIPNRDSSLRHRHSPSSSTRKRRSARHSRYSSTTSKDSDAENGLPGSSNDAEQVTRRIQELKEQQQQIKSELEVDDSPGKAPRTTTKVTLLKQSKVLPRTPSEVDSGRATPNGSKDGRPPFNDSAPSPSVMTGKSRSSRNGAPLASKPTNFSPQVSKSSFDKREHANVRYRRSLEPGTPTKHHRRAPSNPVSPIRRASLSHERPSSADSIDYAVDEYILSPKLTQKVIHPTTGRTIAFSEVGDPKGHVVLCCLGMGLTRYLMAFYDELARTLNLRLVSLDRPGVGESDPHRVDESTSPLSWPDDVAIVCNYLRVTKFSILAHSAGAIYALATALRIPQHIRGRIHLLAPWIPPSQLSSIGSQKEPAPNNAVPYSQRILRALPTSLLKVANTSFMSATSASITTSLPKSPRKAKRKPSAKDTSVANSGLTKPNGTPLVAAHLTPETNEKELPPTPGMPNTTIQNGARKSDATLGSRAKSPSEELERQRDYDTRLTHRIWELATTNANPAVDLLICLERRQTIGFRYVDITRSVVIQHGSKDTRVPVENVQWLGKTMRRCEVRILEGEGHGLMASAGVMGSVLTEIAKEWEDWTTIVQGKRKQNAQNSARQGLAIST